MAFLRLTAEPTAVRANGDEASAIEVDRINVGLALVNWCLLLLLMCGLLLAKTLPADSQLTGGLAADECKGSVSACKDVEAKDVKVAKKRQ